MDSVLAFLSGAMTDLVGSSLFGSGLAGLFWFLAIAGKVMGYLVVLALGLSLKLIAPLYFERATSMIDDNAPASFGIGVLGFVVALGSTLVLTATIIGIPLAFVLVFAYVVLTIVGLALCGAAIGGRLPHSSLAMQPNAQLAVGVLAMMLASIIPFVGEVVMVSAFAIGTGALLRALWTKKSDVYRTPMMTV